MFEKVLTTENMFDIFISEQLFATFVWFPERWRYERGNESSSKSL